MLNRHRRTLVGLFKRVRQISEKPLQTGGDCLELQENLIRLITSAEREIAKSKKEIGSIKSTLRRRRLPLLLKLESQQLKKRMAHQRNRIEDHHLLLDIYRSVGDGLAFSYLDRWDVKPLSSKERGGALSGKKGSRLERKILREAFRHGHIALLNDLTNSLRYGDITLITSKGFFFFEVKSSGNHNRRTGTQIGNIAEMHSYLTTDRTEKLFGLSCPVIRCELQAPPRYYFLKLNKLIRHAKLNGAASAEVEQGLHYLVLTKFDEDLLESCVASCKGVPIFGMLNDLKCERSPHYPLPLIFSDQDELFDFYDDQFIILVVLDSASLSLGFAEHKFRAIIDQNNQYPIQVFCPSQEEAAVKIGRNTFGRIFGECLSPNWLVGEISIRLKELLANPPSLSKEEPINLQI